MYNYRFQIGERWSTQTLKVVLGSEFCVPLRHFGLTLLLEPHTKRTFEQRLCIERSG